MMTPQEMNVAIAEADGWMPNGAGYWRKNGDVRALVEEPEDGESPWPTTYALPNYIGDLNAMHEAEKTLTPDQQIDYLAQLFDLAFAGDQNPDSFMGQVCATALQRAEAFCRVKYPKRFKD